MCQPKEVGGMSFRNLHAHNLALLAQQGWRLLWKPSSLLARIYSAKYYPDENFWSAMLTSFPSSCWRGILAAREVLQQGI